MKENEIETKFAKGVVDGDYVVAKLVTGETLLGKLNKVKCIVEDIALLIPQKQKSEPEEDKKESEIAFYTIPYGFPLLTRVRGESISLNFVVKCFSVNEKMAGLIEHYEKVRDGDFENE
jgi:hypothetical protein